MKKNTQKLALIPVTDRIDAAEQLLIYERTAAKILKISINDFRELVDLSVIPFRLHRGRSKRLYFVDDLRAYVKDLGARYGKKERA
jgi:flagellar biosynthesis GTPase FlhF